MIGQTISHYRISAAVWPAEFDNIHETSIGTVGFSTD